MFLPRFALLELFGSGFLDLDGLTSGHACPQIAHVVGVDHGFEPFAERVGQVRPLTGIHRRQTRSHQHRFRPRLGAPDVRFDRYLGGHRVVRAGEQFLDMLTRGGNLIAYRRLCSIR